MARFTEVQVVAQAEICFRLSSIGYSGREISKLVLEQYPEWGPTFSQPTVASRIALAKDTYIIPAVQDTRQMIIETALYALGALKDGISKGNTAAHREAKGWLDMIAKCTAAYAPTEHTLAIQQQLPVEDRMASLKQSLGLDDPSVMALEGMYSLPDGADPHV